MAETDTAAVQTNGSPEKVVKGTSNEQAEKMKAALIDKDAVFKYGTKKFRIPYLGLADTPTVEEDKELEKSIKEFGVITPVVITDEDVPTVISGHRRLMKAFKLGIPFKDVPVHVRKRDKDDDTRIESTFVANFMQRKMTPERRVHSAHMLRKLEYSARRIGDLLGFDHTTIIEDLAKPDPLAKVEPEIEVERRPAATGKVVGRDGKLHPVKNPGNTNRTKRVQQITKTDIEEGVKTVRQKKRRKEAKNNAIRSVQVLIRCLDRLSAEKLGNKHKDYLQSLLDELRAFGKKKPEAAAAGAK